MIIDPAGIKKSGQHGPVLAIATLFSDADKMSQDRRARQFNPNP